MAVALAAYATEATLAGGTCASSFGFKNFAGGSGTAPHNVGTSGSALGLSNNGTYEVLTILDDANQAASNSAYFNSNLSAINTIFNGINSGGGV
jgi:hypothetical protein